MFASSNDDLAGQVLESLPCDPELIAEIGSEKGNTDLNFSFGGEPNLCLFSYFPQAGHNSHVRAKIVFSCFLDFLQKKIDENFIEIVSTEPGVATG